MADDPRQPVAIRVSRPYASDDEYLERELEMITRTSVVLVGAQSRPQGVILRFEVALTNGTTLIRGEGRVVAFKPRALGDLPGLTLRFTRLDARSKALIDRAAALREARARAALQESMSDSVLPSGLPDAMAKAEMPAIPIATPAPFPVVSTIPSLPVRPSDAAAPPVPPAPQTDLDVGGPPPSPPARRAPPPLPARARAAGSSIEAPREREPLLERLRERRRSLSDDHVRAILTKRAR